MNSPLLSILIPTVPERVRQFTSLLSELRSQIGSYGLYDLVEIISDPTGKQMTIGEKRNRLYEMANGIYSVQWDDDDGIHSEGLELIVKALTILNGVDCVTYEEYVNMDGKEYKSNHSLAYADWYGDGNSVMPDGFHFWRTPFMKDVIKTEIARSTPVPEIRFGEDHEWSRLLKPKLKTEEHIPFEIYRYIHISSNSNERYGLSR